MITVEKLDAGLFGVNLISLRPPRRSVHRDRPTPQTSVPKGRFSPPFLVSTVCQLSETQEETSNNEWGSGGPRVASSRSTSSSAGATVRRVTQRARAEGERR